MPNYQDAKIYKIFVDGVEDVYIGSTTQKLCVRMAQHRSGYKNKYNRKMEVCLSVHNIFDTHGVENCKIVLLENCPCNSKEELHKKEGDYIKNNIKSVNERQAGRTKNEYYNDNIEHFKEYKKKWQEDNKERIAEYRGVHIDCDKCGAKITKTNMSAHKKSLKCQNYKK